MPSVRVAFTPLPAHVRTARLVAIAIARRAGVDEELLDEVRLAVGEACSRAVTINSEQAPDQRVTMVVTDEPDRFTVAVTDAGQGGAAADELGADAVSQMTQAAVPDASDGGDTVIPPGFELAVIRGLVEDVTVDSDGNGTHVTMSWSASGASGSLPTD